MKKMYTFTRLKHQQGITLVELLLYMGIFSTLLMVLVELFGSIVNTSLESQANSAVSQDGRYLLTRIAYDFRQAKASSITLPAGFGSANAGASLSFSTTGGKTYTYFLSSDPLYAGQQDLEISDGVNTDRLNSVGTTVSNLVFTRMKSAATTNPENTITVSFTLTSTTREQKGYQTENFQTTIGTRQ